MSIALLSLFIALLIGASLSALYGLWVGGLAAGLLLILAWGAEKVFGVQIRLGRWPVAVLAPLLWGITGGVYLTQYLQQDKLRQRVVKVAPLKQEVEVDANVNTNRIQVEKDKLIYTLTIRYRDGLQLRIPKITAHPTFNGPFVMPAKEPPRIRFYKTKQGLAVKRWKITLVAVSTGPLNTPRFVIRYTKKGKTYRVTVPRIAVEVGELKQPKHLLGSLRPSKIPILPDRPQAAQEWFWWAVMAGALLLGLGGLTWLSRRQGYQAPELPPHEWFTREYTRLMRYKLLEKQQYKAHYFGLSEAFRGYLERRFLFPALESTTEEIAQWSREQEKLGTEVTRDVRKVLQAMDTIKFAGYTPEDEEVKDIAERVHSVVRQTRTTLENTPQETEQTEA